MPRTRIKICSICRPEDATAAARAGADAVGLICHPAAKRYVPPITARAILQVLPPFVTPVGVFVDATPDHLRDTAATLHLRHLQLHGSEDESVIAALPDFILTKAVKVTPATFADQLRHWTAIAKRHPQLRGLVLETATTSPEAGGTGAENDWSLIAATLRAHPTPLPIIAAGGLSPANVAAVVRLLHPHAVDVSSGVEESLRVKSPGKIAAFVDAVRAAD